MMDISGRDLDSMDLVLVVSPEGLVEWSSHRTRDETTAMLRAIAARIDDGTL